MPRDLQLRVAEWLAGEPSRGPRLLAGAASLEGLHEDLHWRLATLVLDVPPLRDRLDDLPTLLERLRPEGAAAKGLTAAANEAFRAYGWPGNLAELRRVLSAACGRAAGDRIDLADLPMAFREARLIDAEPPPAANALALEETLARVEARLIRLALRRARGNRTRAAELLGLQRARLLRRLEALGIDEPAEGT
jgi:DNA-binding NtrC family response regulator